MFLWHKTPIKWISDFSQNRFQIWLLCHIIWNKMFQACMAGIVFAKFTTPTSRAETIIFRWGGDWILWYFRYLRHSVSARMLWSPCEMELYIWSWEWQTSGSSGGTIKSWARILELNNFDIDVHCFHNVLKNTYCVFKHNLANPTTHQLLTLRTNIPISCLFTVSSVLIDFKCESNNRPFNKMEDPCSLFRILCCATSFHIDVTIVKH